MPFGQIGEIVQARMPRLSSGLRAACNRPISRSGFGRVRRGRAWFAAPAVQRRRLPASCSFGKLFAEANEVARKAGAAGLRPCAAQQRQLQRLDRAPKRALFAAEPAQRMLEQRQQGRRLQLVGDRFRRKPRENAGRDVHQRVAAGIVEQQIPAPKCRHHPPRQGAIRCHQRRRFVQMPRLAHRDRNGQRPSGIMAAITARYAVGDLFSIVSGSASRACQRGEAFEAVLLGRQHIAARLAGLAHPELDVAALDAEALQQRMHRTRWLDAGAGGELAVGLADTADQLPGIIVKIGIEPWQHHRALRKQGYRRKANLPSPASNRSSPPRSPDLPAT